MDAIARRAGVEPYEVRLRNLVRPEQMPFDNVTKKQFDGGDYPQSMRRAVAAIGLPAVRERQRRGEPDGRLLGVGFSIFCEQGAMGTAVLAGWGRPVVPGYEQATVRLTADGDLEIRVGTHSHGQGHETTLAQVAHEILGVDLDRIKVLQGDTLYSPFSTGTWGSRSMVMAGGAVAQASRMLAKRASRIGAWLLQTETADVRIANGSVVGRGASVTLREVARAWYLQPQSLPPDVDEGGLEVTAGYRPARDMGTFSYATHAALIAVDPGTGLIEILDYVVVEDGGTLVNPMIVDGQVQGGTAQGIGTSLLEAVPFDAQGQPGRRKYRISACCTWRHPRRIPNSASKASAKAARWVLLRRSSARSTTLCARSAPRCTIYRSRPSASSMRLPPGRRHARRGDHEADQFRVRACNRPRRGRDNSPPGGRQRASRRRRSVARPDVEPAPGAAERFGRHHRDS
jgi:carbon-monoxide dehydrogenase large subunit